MTDKVGRGFVIRADASTVVGSGHVMRCIALAQQIHLRGLPILFCCAERPGHLGNLLSLAGFDVALLQPLDLEVNPIMQHRDAQATCDAWQKRDMCPAWVIVDHYSLGAPWHKQIRTAGPRLAVIDDLAERPLACDVLVNQNATLELHQRYPDLMLNPRAHLLLGPKYTLLRQEFSEIAGRIAQTKPSNPPRALVVFLGGADRDNLTMNVLEQLSEIEQRGSVHVLLGEMNPNREVVQAWCATHGFNCRLAGEPLGDLLVETRAAVVACGMFAVELQALGIPCLLVPLSAIQFRVAQHFVHGGHALALTLEALRSGTTMLVLLNRLLARPWSSERRSPVALDGAGRVIEHLLEYSYESLSAS